MSSEREYELKFLVDDVHFDKLIVHPLLAEAFGKARTAALKATYFDTVDHRLWDEGVTLRIRDADDHRTETLKQKASSFIDRGEWEWDVDQATPDLDRLRDTPLKHVFRARHLEGDLEPRFTVEVQRTSFRLVHGAAEIEVALDRGAIQAGRRSAPISEMELELKAGGARDLFELARELVATVPLTPSLISKSERGFRLLEGNWGHAVKSVGPADLSPKMAVTAAFQTLAETCLHDLMLNMAAISGEIDIEAVHQARVALRRLRAAMTLFKPRVGGPAFEALGGELKWMSGLLGAARDLDVLQSDVFDPAVGRDQVPGAEPLAAHMRARQKQAHDAIEAALQSERWRLALHDLIAWVSVGREFQTADKSKQDNLRGFITNRLEKRRRALVKLGAGLEGLSPEQRHKVRIQAKKLRYGLEFFRHVHGVGAGSAAYRDLLTALEALQSSLGEVHDQEAKDELLRSEMAASDLQSTPDAEFAAGFLSKPSFDIEKLVSEAQHAYRRVKKTRPFDP